jgi:hypothetical protein
VILQQVCIIPLLYYLALRSPDRMLVIAFIVDLVLEFIVVLSGIPSWLDSILYIRYIFVAALGVWLVFQKQVITRWILFGGLISAVYIFAVYYLNFQFWFFGPYDSFFHAFSYFWTLLIVVLGIQYLPSDSCKIMYRALRELGKASWHIFLVQMTFFFLVAGFLPSSVNYIAILAFFTLIPCLLIGYGFYRLQDFFIKLIKDFTC